MGVFLEEEFDENPKVVLAGEQAAWMYVRALLYCRRNPRTAGRIPKPKVRELTKLVADPRKLAARLVDVGLWEDQGDFYHVHDYELHNQAGEARRVELDAQQQARRDHASKAAMARHHGPKSSRNEQGSSIDRAAGEHGSSNARAMPEQVPGDASRGRAPAPDPVPVPVSPSRSEDSVGVLNGCSEPAQAHAQPDAQSVLDKGAEKEMDQGKPQVSGPVADRWLGLFPRKRQEALDHLGAVLEHLDVNFVDEMIGHCVAMNPPPSSPRYLRKIAADWAQQRGAGLSVEALAELGGKCAAL